MSEFTLTELAIAARVMRAIKDKTYQGTPLGQKVAAYLSWKRDDGASPRTIRDYEATLARLALEHADLSVEAFDGHDGATIVQTFWSRVWKDAERNTRRKVLAHLKDFFRWLERTDRSLHNERVSDIRSPRRAEPERGELFAQHEQNRIFDSCSMGRDRAAVALLFGLGLRRTALRLFRLGDYDRERGVAKFHWKGQRSHTLPVMMGLADILDAHIDERMAEASIDGRDHRTEYLLYPLKIGPSWNKALPKTRLLWEDRTQSLSETALHRWWHTRLDAAGVEHRRMHEARHTAIADFIRRGGRIEQAQLLAGHKSIATTVDTYGHVELADLEAALRRLDAER